MRVLKCLGLTLGLMGLVSFHLNAKQCRIQEEPRGGAHGGGTSGGGTPLERAWVARYPLQPGGAISLENVQGDIAIEPWERAEAEVVVVKRGSGPGARLDDVHVSVEADGRRLALRTTYPKQSEESIRVDFRLRVPRQVRLDRVRTVEGTIKVRDIEGYVDARTLNGNIESLNLTGSVLARTINGNIAVSLRALPEGSAPVRMETVNGHLLLALPADANADLELHTVAGRVDSNYALTVSEDPGDGSFKTRLGRGGTPIRLRTVRGDIHVTENSELL